MVEELSSEQPIQLTVESRAHGWRVDHYLARNFPNYSRSLFKITIENKKVFVNGLPVKAGRRLRVNDCVSVVLPSRSDRALPAENLPISVLYEDESLIVINKQAGMIVHPGRGNYTGTLAGALQFHFDTLSDIAGKQRPGIVHRLDKDTTGVLVVAKDNQVHHKLSRQFEQREVKKEYRAVVVGEVEFHSDYIETHIAVHPRKRELMRVTPEGGNARQANTFYEVLERFAGFAYMKLLPKTGRTHQLRVHMQYLGNPIVADAPYGGGSQLSLNDIAAQELRAEENEVLIRRQALHAFRLEFQHPQSGQPMSFEAPLPEDMSSLLEALRKHRV